MKFHLLTAVTRPENLDKIAKSISQIDCEGVDEICWHLRFDFEKKFAGGQVLKNQMLDSITDGFIFILDDDTILHPQLLKVASSFLKRQKVEAVVVNQVRPNGYTLYANATNLYVGGIDAGQAVMSRELIGGHRIPDHYCGDGEFLSSLLANRGDVLFLNSDLSYHNFLRPE